ncbi:MAG: hypothetical protein RBS37_00155 [Bacteroidales bacterium]|nr:hypothetical protein [Bacteroidales bacterium]
MISVKRKLLIILNNQVFPMYRNFIYILIVGLLAQCNINDTESHDYERSISIAKSNFSDSLTSHFPDRVPGAFRLTTVAPSKCLENGRCGINLIIQLNDPIEADLEERITSMELIKTSFDDCNLIVNPVSDSSDCDKFLDSLIVHCSYFKSVLPNFPQVLNSSKLLIPQEYIDISNFDIYVQESIAGPFLKEENLTVGCGLPSEWRNGFSKGFAIDRTNKKVLFWLEMW